MIDFATIKPGLAAIIATCCGLAPFADATPAARWEDEARPATPGAYALLAVLADTSFGTHETSYDEADAEPWAFGDAWGGEVPPLLETVELATVLTVRVKVEVYTHTAGAEAASYAQRMRARLGWTSTQDALAALGLEFLSFGLETAPVVQYDQRISSVAILDVRFATVNAEQDGTEYSRIESITLSTEGILT